MAFSLVLLLVPLATAASEVYPYWLLRKIVQAPLGRNAKPETARSLYALTGPYEAVHLIVKYPSLQFTEGVIDEGLQNDRTVYGWHRIPVGPVRFHGRRVVQKADDCGDHEVSVPIHSATYPNTVTWYCTVWEQVSTLRSSHAAQFSMNNYKIGPFAVFERRNLVVRRSDNRSVNTSIDASITGGPWWHLTQWLGYATGISNLANGNTIGPYGASTFEGVDGKAAERFLVTGLH